MMSHWDVVSHNLSSNKGAHQNVDTFPPYYWHHISYECHLDTHHRKNLRTLVLPFTAASLLDPVHCSVPAA
jgi:hypothetical protein